ncbi:uncharacterized protein [Solanum tuberosum]|uniref:uncharacterized protein n=1 Tax=Solanum tuberosum TaxID=4113 RepID=UPI00073A0B62|nr:PREDICTED: uncharacterized protein LOC107061379 [Solanum tuberosum]
MQGNPSPVRYRHCKLFQTLVPNHSLPLFFLLSFPPYEETPSLPPSPSASANASTTDQNSGCNHILNPHTQVPHLLEEVKTPKMDRETHQIHHHNISGKMWIVTPRKFLPSFQLQEGVTHPPSPPLKNFRSLKLICKMKKKPRMINLQPISYTQTAAAQFPTASGEPTHFGEVPSNSRSFFFRHIYWTAKNEVPYLIPPCSIFPLVLILAP